MIPVLVPSSICSSFGDALLDELTGDEIEGPNGYRLRFVRNDGEGLDVDTPWMRGLRGDKRRAHCR